MQLNISGFLAGATFLALDILCCNLIIGYSMRTYKLA